MISVAGDGNIKCEHCQRCLVMSELIALHMLTHGLGTVLCVCRHCSHRDDISSFLHHNNSLVNCPKCMFVDFQSPLSSAVSVTNKGRSKPSEGKYKCEVCNARFQKVYRYNRHKLIHLGVKPFLCETCGMKFNQKSSLKLHMMKHDKRNPHLCQWCGQSFRFKVSLQSHILNTHGSLPDSAKKFECDQCNKQFATIYKLHRHYRVHTGDRPYECSICNKWFTQSGNLQNHIKKHKTDSFETFSTDELLENGNEILETILDSCTKGKEFMSLEQQGQPNFSLVGDGNVEKHNPTDLFSDFNPQDVLFDNTPILDSSNANSPIILPNFSSLQGGSSDINL